MRVKKLIEKLEDLATFFTLAASDEGKEATTARKNRDSIHTSFCVGRKGAFDVAFKKVDGILKEAKR